MAVKFKSYLEPATHHKQRKLTKFSERFSTFPNRAMENCDDIFEAVCWVALADEVTKSLANAEEKGETELDRITFLIDHIERDAHNHAKWPRQSTSVTSNLHHRYELVALAEMLELMKSWKNAV